jgi:hypothetical protein
MIEQKVFLPSSLLSDPTREPLQVILPYYQGLKEVPSELGGGDEACLVFIELNKCFKKAGFIAEGMLANVIWGFEQCGYDPRAVASGVAKLRSLGYVEYSDERRQTVHEFGYDAKKPVWIRYTQKMRDLFVSHATLIV